VLRVTNNGTTTTSWIVTLDTKQSTIYNTWNGAFSGTFGTVTARPNQPFNLTLPPGQTTTSVGFCAHRNAPGAMATIVSARPN
jgi:cellulase/cellobiase CelA1